MYNVKESLTRQSDIIPMDKLETPITIVGAGAVGSWVVLQLAKMGFGSIEVYDNDEVSVENLASQFYPHHAIGKAKVDALSSMVEDFTGFGVTTHRYLFYEQYTKGVVISAVDNMPARHKIWQTAKKNGCTTFIDPRMGAESMMIYVMNPQDEDDVTAYEKTLYTDEQAVFERCTAKTTMYCANVLAGMVVHALKNRVCGERYNRVLTFDLREHGYSAWQKGDQTDRRAS